MNEITYVFVPGRRGVRLGEDWHCDSEGLPGARTKSLL